jgi:hypothetical protein
MAKSCYVLELSVTPGTASWSAAQAVGGARRADLFTYNRLVHIRRCLEQEFLGADPEARAYAASLAAGYGETIALWIVERSRLVRCIDLRRHVRVRVGGDPALALAEAVLRDDAWKDRLADGAAVAFEIDWDAIAAEAPALHGEPLRPGEQIDLDVDEEVVSVCDSYLEISEGLRYGYEDLETLAAAPPGFVDPDPARDAAPRG